jgi:hypothetical protein
MTSPGRSLLLLALTPRGIDFAQEILPLILASSPGVSASPILRSSRGRCILCLEHVARELLLLSMAPPPGVYASCVRLDPPVGDEGEMPWPFNAWAQHERQQVRDLRARKARARARKARARERKEHKTEIRRRWAELGIRYSVALNMNWFGFWIVGHFLEELPLAHHIVGLCLCLPGWEKAEEFLISHGFGEG